MNEMSATAYVKLPSDVAEVRLRLVEEDTPDRAISESETIARTGVRNTAKYVMPALGFAHKLDVGAKRLVDGVTDPTLSSGVFYASPANKLKGPLTDQTVILPDLANTEFQDHANEAIHRFITSRTAA